MDMQRLSFLLLGIYVLFMSCTSPAHDHDHDHDHHHGDEDVVSTTDGIHYGAVISEEGAVSFAEVIAMLEKSESIDDVTVIATVGDVCQVKGCWMNVVDGENEVKELFVQFKDYGFFMPKEIGGSRVALKGKASKEIVSVDELKHYAEDKGASKEEIAAISEPQLKLKFMAEGVKILNE
jgi:hypothetical protein